MNRSSPFISVIVLVLPTSAGAVAFEYERVQGLLNVDVSYGVGYRMDDPDPRLVGRANGGAAAATNGDDGNLNTRDGPYAQMARLTGELILGTNNLAFYGRAAAFHDWVQDDPLDRTSLSGRGEELLGSGADLLDHYFGASMTLAGTPVYVRLGDQIVNWGETTFVRDGIDVVSPIDAVTLGQPASQPIDARKPQGMLWVAASPSSVLAIEGFYQYEWESVVVPPVGSYFSTVDVFGGDGPNAVYFGGVSDLGTDLDRLFALPAGTLGFDADFDRMPGRDVDRARDDGQYGVSLFARFFDGLATKIGVSYVHYHSRLPIVSSRTADAAAAAATAPSVVAERAAALLPAYLGTGLDPAAAAVAAERTAESLVLSSYINDAGYVVEYPEDIDMVAGSFSFSLLRTGTLVAGEFARHFDAPYQLSTDTVLAAALSPVEFDPAIGATSLGEFGSDAVIRGYRGGDRSQAALGITQVLGPRLHATQVLVSIDAAAVHVHDAPNADEVPYEGSGRSDDSWGYRVIAVASYSSLFGGVNVAPRIVFGRDVDGTTPAPASTFTEGRQFWSFGINADYLQQLDTDLAYTRFSGGGANNRLRDRDSVQLRLTYSF